MNKVNRTGCLQKKKDLSYSFIPKTQILLLFLSDTQFNGLNKRLKSLNTTGLKEQKPCQTY